MRAQLLKIEFEDTFESLKTLHVIDTLAIPIRHLFNTHIKDVNNE